MSEPSNYAETIKLELQVSSLQAQLTQRTRELEAADRERSIWKEKAECRGKEACKLRAELERVTQENDRLHALIMALPKVEGKIIVQRQYGRKNEDTWWEVLTTKAESWRWMGGEFPNEAEADAYANLLRTRQEME